VAGHDGEPEAVADHKHSHVLDSESILDIFRVAREAEALVGHRLLVDRAGDQHVYLALLEFADGGLKREDSPSGGLGGGLSGLCECAVRQAVDDIDALRVSLLCAADGVGVHLLDLRDGLAVEAEKLR